MGCCNVHYPANAGRQPRSASTAGAREISITLWNKALFRVGCPCGTKVWHVARHEQSPCVNKWRLVWFFVRTSRDAYRFDFSNLTTARWEARDMRLIIRVMLLGFGRIMKLAPTVMASDRLPQSKISADHFRLSCGRPDMPNQRGRSYAIRGGFVDQFRFDQRPHLYLERPVMQRNILKTDTTPIEEGDGQGRV